MTNRSETPAKRECFERVVQELNLDTTDPFTRLFANLLAIADRVDGLKAALTAAQALAEQRQAEIYRLMLEFCPEEMTPEQLENWGKHQRPVSKEVAAAIDAAAPPAAMEEKNG